jgi:osmotically-inducible protein OsmY
MQSRRCRLSAGLLVMLLSALAPVHVLSDESNPNLPAVDNSKMNQKDRSDAHPTADQSMNDRMDLQTARLIRKSIVDDKSLSIYAHNVKVIAQKGRVTLKGTVHTAAEKNNIEAKARFVAGDGNVTNNINVKGS